ncbi:uncharacterized protein LOC119675661 [Teleopsis dalmanni]|uniref:uncharacterized protein LOC119675661 n=1 Tax=Teleopsis dalmanni TaxID=139649 RepID=UPI0018CDC9C5|nr:uncharacterized protein LOC119675661 [Teleopsis dalmanni]
MLQHEISKSFLLLLVGLNIAAATIYPPDKKESKSLSRKKRYVAFPEGSSVSAAICMTVGVIGNPNVNYLSWAVNWGVAYDLPNHTWVRQHANGFKTDLTNTKQVVLRRSRRDLYEKIELAINDMGFNGHACIARALCESSKYLGAFRRKRGNMIEEIVKTIFSLPTENVHSHEPQAVHQYDRIYRRAKREVVDCSTKYAECQFSLLELALGKYLVQPNKHGPFVQPMNSFM